VISATHCDLLQKIEAKEFRADLYYRLNGLCLTMPPLRERSDKRALIDHVLERESDGSEIVLDEELTKVLLHYAWPGNLRELRNTLRTVIALRSGDELTVSDLPVGFAGAVAQAADDPAQQLNALEHAERDALLQELVHQHWNISHVAKKLKVSRNTLYRKLQRLNIRESDKATHH
jgi:transcriptional regulator of acetoin/glycerol metabolism